jgi:hypothetical protein
MVVKFLEQLTLVMDALEDSGCYDPTDRFFYDLLTDALGNRERVQVQTLVGVIPALPAMTLPTRNSHQIQRLRKRFTRRKRRIARFWTGGFVAVEIAVADWSLSWRRTSWLVSSAHCSMRMRSCLRTDCVPCQSATQRRIRCPVCRVQRSNTSRLNLIPQCMGVIRTGVDRYGSRSIIW